MEELSDPVRRALLAWFRAGARDLPWRRERTPYRIWISEIMLQQTRVETVLPYYEAFLEAFPGVAELAAAPDDDVMAHWAGLGYYSRARNLLSCARELTARYGGHFPNDPHSLRSLPGFGPYTTAAVGSLAFGLPLAVLDGNVMRVLCRLFLVEEDPARPKTRARLQDLADAVLEPSAPGEWNEAMMELGARLCLPRRPRCDECPLAPNCRALACGRQGELPSRAARNELPTRDTLILLVQTAEGDVLARRRGDDGMLRGLWELPGAERQVASSADPAVAWRELDLQLRRELGLGAEAVEAGTLGFRHGYSHFLARVLARRLRLNVRQEPGADYRWLTVDESERLGFSARDRRILDETQWDLPETDSPA